MPKYSHFHFQGEVSSQIISALFAILGFLCQVHFQLEEALQVFQQTVLDPFWWCFKCNGQLHYGRLNNPLIYCCSWLSHKGLGNTPAHFSYLPQVCLRSSYKNTIGIVCCNPCRAQQANRLMSSSLLLLHYSWRTLRRQYFHWKG